MNMTSLSSTPCREVTVSLNELPEQARHWGEPVVMRQLLAEWPLVKAGKASDESLRCYVSQFYNNRLLTFYSGVQENQFDIGFKEDMSGFTFMRETGCLNDVFARMAAEPNNACYIGSTPTSLALPGLEQENDIDFSPFKPLVNFWLGSQSRIMTHYDTPDNIACCVAGRRSFLLFPPDQVGNLYVGPVDLTPSGRPISMTAVDTGAMKKNPKLSQALKHSQLADLEPGDALYIPPLWWHQVTSKDRLNMLINYWWRFSPRYLGTPDLALEHAILALRGLPDEQRKAWKSMFDYYVFSDAETAVKDIPEALRGILDSSDERAIRAGWSKFSKKLHL
jgi:hypothetical protein